MNGIDRISCTAAKMLPESAEVIAALCGDLFVAVRQSTVEVGQHVCLGTDCRMQRGDPLRIFQRRLVLGPRTTVFTAPGFERFETVADQLFGGVAIGRAGGKWILVTGERRQGRTGRLIGCHFHVRVGRSVTPP